MLPLNRPKARVLRALLTVSLDAGRIELAQITGISGQALENVIAACVRRGYIDETTGMTSAKGRARLSD